MGPALVPGMTTHTLFVPSPEVLAAYAARGAVLRDARPAVRILTPIWIGPTPETIEALAEIGVSL